MCKLMCKQSKELRHIKLLWVKYLDSFIFHSPPNVYHLSMKLYTEILNLVLKIISSYKSACSVSIVSHVTSQCRRNIGKKYLFGCLLLVYIRCSGKIIYDLWGLGKWILRIWFYYYHFCLMNMICLLVVLVIKNTLFNIIFFCECIWEVESIISLKSKKRSCKQKREQDDF